MDRAFCLSCLKDDCAPVFLCNKDLRITAVGRLLTEASLPVKSGDSLFDLFAGYTSELHRAKQELRTGKPHFSPKLEINLQRYGAFFLPETEGNEFSGAVVWLLDLSTPIPHSGSGLLPIVSDRFRTPVTNILNLLYEISGPFSESENYRQLSRLNEAANSCYSILRSTTELNDYYRLVNGEIPFKTEAIVGNDFFRHLTQQIQTKLAQAGYTLNQPPLEEMHLGILCLSPRLFSLAVYHIVLNACIYSPHDSTVHIKAETDGRHFTVTVTDEGSGIPPDKIQQVLEPFFSYHDAPVPEEEMGLGLGLPIAKKIMELHQGTLSIFSQMHHGTTVKLSIPIPNKPFPAEKLNTPRATYYSLRFSDADIVFSDICKSTFL